MTTTEYDREYAIAYDKEMRERVELMYSYDDLAHDRHVLRNRFLREMNKKTTLKDIGAKLDEFILDNKANQAEFF
jgi:DNA-directed RNA polymerase sigma subunit (sigma70/sigma32)